jgi:plasmid stability protein
MSTTLTIRNLDEGVKLKLRMRAASHQRSMEAEARDILTRETLIQNQARRGVVPTNRGGRDSACAAVRGAWKGRVSTDEVMTITRGD